MNDKDTILKWYFRTVLTTFDPFLGNLVHLNSNV